MLTAIGLVIAGVIVFKGLWNMIEEVKASKDMPEAGIAFVLTALSVWAFIAVVKVLVT